METEPRLVSPTADDIFAEQNKRKEFKSFSDMLNFLSFAKPPAHQAREGHNKRGEYVYELVYVQEDV